MKDSLNTLFTTREVIEIQSTLYYQHHSNLGFDTVANTYPEYARAIGRYLARIWKLFLSRKGSTTTHANAAIIELGPGTGSFSRMLMETLDELGVTYTYYFVDVNPKVEDLANELEAVFYQTTFEQFARSWKDEIDFLIANQALDMWAGNNLLNFDANDTRTVKWKLFDSDAQEYRSKKEIPEILRNEEEGMTAFWLKHVEHGDKKWSRITPELGKAIFDEYVKIPQKLESLLKKTRLGGVFQDYWSFDTPNPLAAGLTRVECQLIQKTFPNDPWIPLYIHYDQVLARDELMRKKTRIITKNKQKNEAFPESIAWVPSPIIPLGRVDVTYAPNIQELLDQIEKLKFHQSILTIDELITKELELSLTTSPTDWKSERFIVLYEKEWLHALSFQ